MSKPLSPNTQAILLLTAPLIAGRAKASADLLTLGDYKRLARVLRDRRLQPSDLLGPAASSALDACRGTLDPARLERLLGRGFLLSQAVERWQSRAIWVMSRADTDYPRRIKARLKEDAPPVLYGCGDASILDSGGLAVVGSRNAEDVLLDYAAGIGELAASAGRTLVSGGARGIDQAAMRGALGRSGQVVGVMADSLERAALTRDHREFLIDGRLVLTSPYDPQAGFNVGHAMQRNKLIYALADAALVVNADLGKGGTWNGAVEQLDDLRFAPVYVRSTGESSRALDALKKKGALPWLDRTTPESLSEMLDVPAVPSRCAPEQEALSFSAREAEPRYEVPIAGSSSESLETTTYLGPHPAEELWAKVKEILGRMTTARTIEEIATDLGVTKIQAQAWLLRLEKEGVVERVETPKRPVRYRACTAPLLPL